MISFELKILMDFTDYLPNTVAEISSYSSCRTSISKLSALGFLTGRASYSFYIAAHAPIISSIINK